MRLAVLWLKSDPPSPQAWSIAAHLLSPSSSSPRQLVRPTPRHWLNEIHTGISSTFSSIFAKMCSRFGPDESARGLSDVRFSSRGRSLFCTLMMTGPATVSIMYVASLPLTEVGTKTWPLEILSVLTRWRNVPWRSQLGLPGPQRWVSSEP